MGGARHFLDVSELEPPEPLLRVLEWVDGMGDGEFLQMYHRREPCLLYPNLERRGFSHLTRTRGSGFTVFIWRAGDDAAERAVRTAVSESVEE